MVPIQLQAAIIGAITGILSVFIKDFLCQLFFQKRNLKQKESSLFKLYADPFCKATMDLLWRLKELREQAHENSYLYSKYESEYARYKRESTIYRLAVFLGWKRIIYQETTILKTKNNKQLKMVKESLNSFTSSLADGNSIEVEQLNKFLSLWKFGELTDEESKKLASLISNKIDGSLHSMSIFDLSEEQKKDLCSTIAQYISDSFHKDPISIEILNSTYEQAIQFCSLKECWIYRDCQDAIGDMMIQRSNNLYSIISFYGFHKKNTNKEDSYWISQIESFFVDLDTSGTDKNDMRVEQLNKMILSIAKLIKALTYKDKKRQLYMSQSIKLADKLIEDLERPLDKCKNREGKCF